MNLPMAPTAAPAVFENIPALQAEVRALAAGFFADDLRSLGYGL